MKRFVFVALMLLSGISFAQSTAPVIPFGDRKPDLYYWDTNWIDRYEHLHPNTTPYPASIGGIHYQEESDKYIGRACQANTPILVRGIAGMARTAHRFQPMLTINTSRAPEWFIMFDTNFNKLGEGRWDTLDPNYRMEIRYGNVRDSIDLYEVFFDKPVLVSGRFYVGGTTHNNLAHGRNIGDESYSYGQPEHMVTVYPNFRCNESYVLPCNPPVALERYFWPYNVANPRPNDNPAFDTSSFQLVSCQYTFHPFFAIIDTEYVYYDCQRPTGLRVGYADEDSVAVVWDSTSTESFDVMVWTDGIEPDSGMHFTLQTNCLELTGLDTSRWYNIKVKALCDTIGVNTSAWSEVFRLRVSDYIVRPCPVPEGLWVQLLQPNGAIVRWNQSDAGQWDLALWREDSADTLTMQRDVEYAEIDGLDTAVWYAVRLRAVCDSGNISEWSDTVRFYVPNWDTTGGGTEPVGIDIDADRNIQLQPNPTSDKVTVLSSIRMRRIELFGSDGKLIASYAADGHTATLDLEAYPSGVYLVRVATSSGVTNKRLVKR